MKDIKDMTNMDKLYTLQDNEVAILWYETREVEIITIPDLDEVEDLEQYLEEELEYDMSNACYMS